MHAARAIHKQRERREEKLKLEVRRPSASSQISRNILRSPAVSIDASSRRNHSSADGGERFNFSYAGFIIASFGAVPLLVGTFVEVPALWEIGLGVTLVGIFIGLVFWCTELCAEAKKFSKKKKQLSTRGKIEDSNLLQVPDRKSHRHNGLTSDSRRGSLQSDSISLISPTAQHYENQQRHAAGNPLQLHNSNLDRLRGEDSISQYSSSEGVSKLSNDSSGTLKSKPNGHLILNSLSSSYLPSGGNKSKKVSLVQQDPGLDDDSDSDAETVIEAPTGSKIIHVQSENHHPTTRHLLFKGESLSSVTDPLAKSVVDMGSKPHLATSFSLENETISPLVPHHRTVLRMPVMPQEIEKLKRCECGRYLMDTDKLISLRGHHPYMAGGSMPPTAYNSPAWSIGLNPSRKVFGSVGGAVGVVGSSSIAGGTLNDLSNNSSLNDVSSDNPPDNTKIISVNPSSTSNISWGTKVSGNNTSVTTTTASHLPTNESVVQVEPTLSSSTAKLLRSHQNLDNITKTENIENFAPAIVEANDDDGGDKDKLLAELLNITAETDEKPEPMRDSVNNSLSSMNDVKTTEIKNSLEEPTPTRQRHFSEQATLEAAHASRPNSLPLQSNSAIDLNYAPALSGSSTVITPASSSSASTVVSTGVTAITPFPKDDDDDLKEEEIEKEQHDQRNSAVSVKSLAKDMSLDELLDTIEQKSEGTTGSGSAVAVAVQ